MRSGQTEMVCRCEVEADFSRLDGATGSQHFAVRSVCCNCGRLETALRRAGQMGSRKQTAAAVHLQKGYPIRRRMMIVDLPRSSVRT